MRVAVLTVLIVLALAPAAAAAERQRDPRRSPELWATVNLCDTAGRPNAIGIRGSMPGSGRRERAFMRFQVQYLARSDGKWHNIAAGADSGWIGLGLTRRRVVESGFTFTFRPPSQGRLTLRGVVTFMWKRGPKTTRRIRELTEAGHRSTVGADPPGYSSATCEIA